MDENTKILATFNAYDNNDIELFSHASNYQSVLWDIEDFLKGIYKWHLDDYKTTDDLLDAICAKIHELKTEAHLPINY